MKLFTIYVTLATLCLGTVSADSYAQDSEPQIETITYDLDGGNLNATDYNPEFFNPEPLHAHNVPMEPIVSHGLDGVFSNGWEEGQELDTTQYLHLRVNINPGYVYHLDSITFTGTGTSWYGPIVSGLIVNDADTLAGSTVGWQVCDSVLYCVSSMWYTYQIYDVYPYTWHDTLVNWWQINSSTHLDIRLFAWGNIPDTLGNPMASTGWIVDHIQFHGKILPDMSTDVLPIATDVLQPIRFDGYQFVSSELGQIIVYDAGGKVKAADSQGRPIDTTGWTDGVYIAEFISVKQQRYTKRYLVTH